MANLEIAITKAKGKAFVIDKARVNALLDNPRILEEAVTVYLGVMLNLGMSKLPATKELTGEALEAAQAKAMEVAEANFAAIEDGSKIGKRSGKAKSKAKEDQKVINEALRLCREVVRDRLKAAGIRLNTRKASEITEAAKRYFAEREDFYIAKAKTNLAEREAEVEANGDAEFVDAILPKADPKKLAKLQAEKAERSAEAAARAAAGYPTKRGRKAKSARASVPTRKGDTPQHASH
jgi:predicted DNA-binding protein